MTPSGLFLNQAAGTVRWHPTAGPDTMCRDRGSLKMDSSMSLTDDRGKATRILLILTEFPPRVGGMQTHALYLSHYLAARGYDVIVVTYRPVDREEIEAVAQCDITLGYPVLRVLSRLSHWYNLSTLVSLGRQFAPHLIYSSTVYYGLLGGLLGAPVISRSVGNDILRPWIAYPFRFGSGLFRNPWLERQLFRWFNDVRSPDWLDAIFRERRRTIMAESLRATARIIANSEFTAAIIRRIGISPRRIGILVGGVDYPAFAAPGDGGMLRHQLGIPAECFILLSVCRLVAKKGIDFLLAAFADLRASMPDAHLVIVGNGPHYRDYLRYRDERGLSGSVTFTGQVPHHKVAAYYKASDLFVLASRETTHPKLGLRDAETMGRVLCEANAAGIPVVASRCGGIPSVVTDGRNGLLFKPDDVSEFKNRVHLIRDDELLRNQLISEGRRRAREHFDWSVILNAHQRIFAEVQHEHSSPAN